MRAVATNGIIARIANNRHIDEDDGDRVLIAQQVRNMYHGVLVLTSSMSCDACDWSNPDQERSHSLSIPS